MLNFKQNITQIPNYLDGYLDLYQINQTSDDYPVEYLANLNQRIFFEEISITDKLKYELNKRDSKVYKKVRIPQYKQLGSLNVVKIDDICYSIFNAYHFTNNDGYPQTDLTLEEYPNPRFAGDNND